MTGTDHPEVSIEPTRRSFWQRASYVWLIPIAALIISLGVAWQAFSARGPVIEIVFADASGVAARQTELRYRDVTVGLVEDLTFTPDLTGVVASVRLKKGMAPFVDVAANFWIVRPELTTQGVSGLDTVLTGVYIEGAWDDEIGAPQTRFQGLEDAPLIRSGEDGLQITLRTTRGGSLADNSPITFRGIDVGRVGQAFISPAGNFAVAEAVIYAPHSRLITPNTRFWDSSGFTFTFGPNGAELDFSSLASLVSGGITFDTFVSGGGPAQDGAVYEVFSDQEAARDSLFRKPEVETLDLRLVFEENIAGLAVDAPVELGGLRIGRVESVSGIIDESIFGDNRVRLNVLVEIQPAQLGLQQQVTPDAALDFLRTRVDAGLRARLATTGLLGQGLKIELVQVPDAPPDPLRTPDGGIPILPTTQSDTESMAATVEGVVTRINDLPIEELLDRAISFLASAETLLADPDLRATPGDARALLADIRAVTSSDGVQQIPSALETLLTQLETLLGQIEAAQLAARIGAASDAAAGAATGVSRALEGVPALIARLDAVAANATALPLDQLTEDVAELTRSATAILTRPSAQTLPDTLSETVTSLGDLLAELQNAQTAARLTAALDAAALAASTISASAEGIPDLLEALASVAQTAADLPLEDLVRQATRVTQSADAILATDAAQDLPEDLAAALREINASLAALREGGAVENVNNALDATRRAADAVAGATDALPDLVARAQDVLSDARRTLSGFDQGEVLSRDAQAALRDISKAADALTSLGQMLERNPSSLLRGR